MHVLHSIIGSPVENEQKIESLCLPIFQVLQNQTCSQHFTQLNAASFKNEPCTITRFHSRTPLAEVNVNKSVYRASLKILFILFVHVAEHILKMSAGDILDGLQC